MWKNKLNVYSIEHIEVLDADGLDCIEIEKLRKSSKEINHNKSISDFILEQKEDDFLEELQESNIIPRINCICLILRLA